MAQNYTITLPDVWTKSYCWQYGMKPLLAAILICACSATHETFPTNTVNERQWKQEYRDGKLSWSEYQAKLKAENKREQ